MNKCYLQRWEESERNIGLRNDGASLHLNIDSHKDYLDFLSKERGEEVPQIYSFVSGPPVEVFIEDDLYKELSEKKTIKLFEFELNNLLKLEEITLKQTELF